MEHAQVALKLILNELEQPSHIRTVRERKTIQKAIYLAQASGVELGYGYNWYVMGPYSPGLTRDYYALDEALEAGDQGVNFELQGPIAARLRPAKALMTPPASVTLDQSEWLELLASVHFLITKQRLSIHKVREKLQVQKGHVAPFTDIAYDLLQSEGLLTV